MVMSLIYWALRRVLELIVARRRRDSTNEIELLVLRHELAVLRRQSPGHGSARRTERCWRRSAVCCRGNGGQVCSFGPRRCADGTATPSLAGGPTNTGALVVLRSTARYGS
jgi:hypothetical protein